MNELLSFKSIIAVLAGLGMIVGAAWALDARIDDKISQAIRPVLRVVCYNAELLRIRGEQKLPDCVNQGAR